MDQNQLLGKIGAELEALAKTVFEMRLAPPHPGISGSDLFLAQQEMEQRRLAFFKRNGTQVPPAVPGKRMKRAVEPADQIKVPTLGEAEAFAKTWPEVFSKQTEERFEAMDRQIASLRSQVAELSSLAVDYPKAKKKRAKRGKVKVVRG